MTSLLDVLFIVVFASLIHSAALEKKASQAAVPPPPGPEQKRVEPASPPAPAAQAAADPAVQAARKVEELRGAAVAQLMASIEGRTPLVARIGREGKLRAIERQREGRVVPIPLGLPLVERVPDPDVALIYVGDRQDGLRLCSLLRLHIGAPDLSDVLVIVAPDAPLEQLSVALARGLQRDAERCLAEQKGIAVIVDPRAAEAARQTGGTR